MARLFKVKVTKFNSKENWYASHVGEEFMVHTTTEGNVLEYYKLSKNDERRIIKALKKKGENTKHIAGLGITKSDCEVVEEK